MYEELDMAIEDAILLFAEARPDGIYKEHYVEALLEKYGGDVCVLCVLTCRTKSLSCQAKRLLKNEHGDRRTGGC